MSAPKTPRRVFPGTAPLPPKPPGGIQTLQQAEQYVDSIARVIANDRRQVGDELAGRFVDGEANKRPAATGSKRFYYDVDRDLVWQDVKVEETGDAGWRLVSGSLEAAPDPPTITVTHYQDVTLDDSTFVVYKRYDWTSPTDARLYHLVLQIRADEADPWADWVAVPATRGSLFLLTEGSGPQDGIDPGPVAGAYRRCLLRDPVTGREAVCTLTAGTDEEIPYPPATNATKTEEGYYDGDGHLTGRRRVFEWTPPADANLYYVVHQYKPTGSDDWLDWHGVAATRGRMDLLLEGSAAHDAVAPPESPAYEERLVLRWQTILLQTVMTVTFVQPSPPDPVTNLTHTVIKQGPFDLLNLLPSAEDLDTDWSWTPGTNTITYTPGDGTAIDTLTAVTGTYTYSLYNPGDTPPEKLLVFLMAEMQGTVTNQAGYALVSQVAVELDVPGGNDTVAILRGIPANQPVPVLQVLDIPAGADPTTVFFTIHHNSSYFNGQLHLSHVYVIPWAHGSPCSIVERFDWTEPADLTDVLAYQILTQYLNHTLVYVETLDTGTVRLERLLTASGKPLRETVLNQTSYLPYTSFRVLGTNGLHTTVPYTSYHVAESPYEAKLAHLKDVNTTGRAAGDLLRVAAGGDGYEHQSQGAGSGLDADTLDGQHASAFAETADIPSGTDLDGWIAAAYNANTEYLLVDTLSNTELSHMVIEAVGSDFAGVRSAYHRWIVGTRTASSDQAPAVWWTVQGDSGQLDDVGVVVEQDTAGTGDYHVWLRSDVYAVARFRAHRYDQGASGNVASTERGTLCAGSWVSSTDGYTVQYDSADETPDLRIDQGEVVVAGKWTIGSDGKLSASAGTHAALQALDAGGSVIWRSGNGSHELVLSAAGDFTLDGTAVSLATHDHDADYAAAGHNHAFSDLAGTLALSQIANYLITGLKIASDAIESRHIKDGELTASHAGSGFGGTETITVGIYDYYFVNGRYSHKVNNGSG